MRFFIVGGLFVATAIIVVGLEAVVLRDAKDQEAFQRTAQFSEAARCLVVGSVGPLFRTSDSGSCTFWQYTLTLCLSPEQQLTNGLLSPWHNATAYSGLLAKECGDPFVGASSTGAFLPCWYKCDAFTTNPANATPVLVRIVPAVARNLIYRQYGIACLVIGSVPIALFISYNVFLLLAVHCYNGKVVRGSLSSYQRSAYARRHEPFAFELQNRQQEQRQPQERPNPPTALLAAFAAPPTWFARLTGNAYAQAVLRRLTEDPPIEGGQVVEQVVAEPIAECPICYETSITEVVMFPCGHYTCRACAKRCLRAQGSIAPNLNVVADGGAAQCPQCRAGIARTDAVLVRLRTTSELQLPFPPPQNPAPPPG